jgi:GTPase
MLDDKFRKVKEDVQWMLSRIDRVPPEVRALMKYPELPKA